MSINNKNFEFGLTIPQGWRSGDLPLEEENNPVKQYEFARNISLAAERIGYDSLYAYDHFIPHFRGDIEKNIFECFTLLSSIASITNRIKIGQVVMCNSYRHPSLVSKMISTLDIISNGRMEIGVGAGWFEEEYNAYGYDFPSNALRISQLDEALIVIKKLLSEDRASFNGNHYRISNAICNPKPIQKPHPVIMIGGAGEKYLLKVVAKHANRYNLFFGTPQDIKKKISVLNGYCRDIGRDLEEIEYSIVLPCIIGESEEIVKKILLKNKRKDKSMKQYLEYLVDGITVGTPEKIIRGLNEYIDQKVTHFIIHFLNLNQDSLESFKSKVVNNI
ncbi:MAG: TIGR03560 family F420-dependent LLM class oxidoreductase [Nitrososphaeraceae archaeon]